MIITLLCGTQHFRTLFTKSVLRKTRLVALCSWGQEQDGGDSVVNVGWGKEHMLSPSFKFTVNITVLKAQRIPTILRKVS